MTHRGRVLLVDDEADFLDMTARMLRHAGYECETARDSTEALCAVTRAPYDVVIADINMAGNRELELVRDIRERFSDLPVILITGNPSLGTAIAALRLAAIDYIVKPPEREEFVKRIDKAIRTHRTRLSFGRQLEEFGPVIEKLREIQRGLARGADEEAEATPVGRGQPGAPDAASRSLPASVLEQLSPREREILDALAAGQRVGNIAQAFGISAFTVRNHLKAIFRKLGVHSQVELLAQVHARSRAEHSSGPT
jgi:DNA-binding NarL/FixJ family response regulator